MRRKIISFGLCLSLLLSFVLACKKTVNPKPAKDTTPPGKVQDFNVKAGDKKLDLRWKNPNDEDFYKAILYVKVGADRLDAVSPVERKDLKPGKTEYYTVTGLDNDKEYSCKIDTYDKAGNKTEGDYISATPKDASLTIGRVLYNGIEGTSHLEAAHRVTIRFETDKEMKVAKYAKGTKDSFDASTATEATLAPDKKSATFELSDNGMYTIYAEGEVAGTKVTDTYEISIENIDKEPPAQVSDVDVKSGIQSLKLSWKKPTDSDFDGVEITVLDKSGSAIADYNPRKLGNTSISETINNLKDDEEYTIRIVTVDKLGNKSKAVEVKGIPSSGKLNSALLTTAVTFPNPTSKYIGKLEIYVFGKNLDNALTAAGNDISINDVQVDKDTIDLKGTYAIKLTAELDDEHALESSVLTSGITVEIGTKKITAPVHPFTLEVSDDYTKVTVLSATKFEAETTIPEGVTHIKDGALKNASGKIKLAKSLQEIGKSAFQGSSVTAIDFTQCTKLRTIGESAFQNCKQIEGLVLPESLEEIGKSAFQASSVKEFDFAKCTKLATIGESVFRDCANITNVDLSKTKLTKINKATFMSCSQLNKITFPVSLEEIADGANKGTSAVNEGAFRNCESLQTIVFPEGSALKKIGHHAFTGYVRPLKPSNQVLTSIDLSMCTKLTTIGFCAFYALPNATITLPDMTEEKTGVQPNIDRAAFGDNGASMCKEVIVPNEEMKILVKASGYTETITVTP